MHLHLELAFYVKEVSATQVGQERMRRETREDEDDNVKQELIQVDAPSRRHGLAKK